MHCALSIALKEHCVFFIVHWSLLGWNMENNVYYLHCSLLGHGEGEALKCQRYVPHWRLPISDSSAAPETHLFTPSVSYYALHFPLFFFFFFEKFSIWRPISLWFWQNFGSKPTTFGKNLFCRPYLWKPAWHRLTKKDLSAPQVGTYHQKWCLNILPIAFQIFIIIFIWSLSFTQGQKPFLISYS